MSILFRNSRPVVAFDVTNQQHRKWYAEFVKYRTWGRCPVQFVAEVLDQDLVSFINDKMLTHYLSKEFENAKAKNTVKVRTKSKPKSTPSAIRTKLAVQAKSGKEQVTVSA